jgi:ubiquinone/menaquinone biosynthesis C-methylase UbiE
VKRKPILLFSYLGAATLVGVGAWLYLQRPRDRIRSRESLDDPDVAKAFGTVSIKVPWKLLRWYIARHALSLRNQGTAVDIGCGPGYLVALLAKKSKGLHITGLDLSEEMLEQALAHAQAVGVENRVAFKIGDAGRLPFEDHSVDLVVSSLSLHHWCDPIEVMNEIARVLRPGGAFLIFDIRRDLAAHLWLFLWFITHFIVPDPLRRVNEPLSSRDAAYTCEEAGDLLEKSELENGIVLCRPGWLVIEGRLDD